MGVISIYNKLQYTATCLMGCEGILSHELKALGADDIRADNGRVFFSGNENICARANICLRTAERVLVVVGSFHAESFEELFDGVSSLPWEDYISRGGAFPVQGGCISSRLRSVPDCQAIIKKAIAKRLGRAYAMKMLPETGALYRARFLILKDHALVMLDTSGEPLYKRGYRIKTNDAPIRETLAAALADISHVYSAPVVVDPCCGSGTILIESVLKALNLPSNPRRSFAAEQWTNFSGNVWAEERERTWSLARTDKNFHAYGFDIDADVLDIAMENAKQAGVAEYITFERRDIADYNDNFERAAIICNPPYGQRLLDITQAERIYKTMGERFTRKNGHSYTIITPDDNFERCFGARADKRRKLYNGMIECTAYMYFKSNNNASSFSR